MLVYQRVTLCTICNHQPVNLWLAISLYGFPVDHPNGIIANFDDSKPGFFGHVGLVSRMGKPKPTMEKNLIFPCVSWPSNGHQIHAASVVQFFTTPLFGFGRWLVGGWPTPLKNMKVSWDCEIPKIWKNKKRSKPPTRWGTFLIPRDVYHSSNMNIQFGGLMIVTDTHVRLSEHSPQNQTFAHAHIISRFCHGFNNYLIQIHRGSLHWSIIFTIGSMMSNCSDVLCYIILHHYRIYTVNLPPPSKQYV